MNSTRRVIAGLVAALCLTLVTTSLATPLPLHNTSFEAGATNWHASGGSSFTVAGDSRALAGSNLSYFGANIGSMWQIVSTNPDDTSTQFQFQPDTVYKLTAFGMTGSGGQRVPDVEFRGTASASTSFGSLIAARQYEVEPISSPRTGYVLAPDAVTYWRTMTVELDTAHAPAAVGKYIAVGSSNNTGFSPNYDGYSVEATTSPSVRNLPIHNPSVEIAALTGSLPPHWTGPSFVRATDSRSLDGAALGFLSTNTGTFGEAVSWISGDSSTQIQIQPGFIYTLRGYGMSGGGATRTAILSLLGDNAASTGLGSFSIVNQSFGVDPVTSPTAGYVLAPDGITYWREMEISFNSYSAGFTQYVGKFLSFSVEVPSGTSSNFDLFTLTATVVPEPAAASVIFAACLLAMRRRK